MSTDDIPTSSNRSTSFFWLDSTLNQYEVEELDGFELAQYLSRFPSNEEQQDESGSHEGAAD